MITRLRGEMTPEQMHADIEIQPTAFREQLLRVGRAGLFDDHLVQVVAAIAGIAAFAVGIAAGFFNAPRWLALILTCVIALLAGYIAASNVQAGVYPIEQGLVASPSPPNG